MHKTGESVYDFLVVGGGIAGLSSAYHLMRDGYSVAVLEGNDGKQSASFNSTAMMCHDPDVDWQAVIARFGTDGARQVWELGELGMRLLGDYAHAYKPSFITKRVPAHIFATSAEKAKALRAQYELYRTIGVPAVFSEKDSALLSSFRAVLTVAKDGMTNNQAMLRTLKARVRTGGGKVFLNTPVHSVSCAGGGVEVSTEKHIFRGRQAIIATGDQKLFPDLPATNTHRTFVVGFENHAIPTLFRSSILWDNEEPYHYIRSFKGNTIWVGGEDIEESGYDPKGDYVDRLETFAKKHLLFDSSYKRTAAWSGTFFPTKTGLPYIGKVPDKPIFFSLGFGGTGIVMSFVSGYLLAAWLKGKETEYQSLFAVAHAK